MLRLESTFLFDYLQWSYAATSFCRHIKVFWGHVRQRIDFDKFANENFKYAAHYANTPIRAQLHIMLHPRILTSTSMPFGWSSYPRYMQRNVIVYYQDVFLCLSKLFNPDDKTWIDNLSLSSTCSTPFAEGWDKRTGLQIPNSSNKLALRAKKKGRKNFSGVAYEYEGIALFIWTDWESQRHTALLFQTVWEPSE